ncbi:AAC(3) family N-acetyltransferase [Streptomyces litchfieldiae]|uniref:AAC(3) family N-acetyltransferase n=1 Tax=Streptomyces litchfieldiae TaxID=3075543 RepID=A0ABU2MUB0_9ACTN|nr:AAC(3) family N-acetyltransferase [Streptomyces sp. DSM 44938]MDT0345232.1 AAC(3) family N-acetyltransferase [Streptomyces sp. DSM 44938]
MAISAAQLATAIDALDLAGRPVMTHSSLRSFGEPVDGGADGVLDALLERGCTVLVPSFTESHFSMPAPKDRRLERNGIDYDHPYPPPSVPRGWSVDCGLIDRSMGTLPATLIARPGAHRGDHPLDSFAALGPLAAELTAAQSPADVYGPVRALAERRGTVLLIGVGLDRMTALHLAERQSGRRLFVRWAKTADGRTAPVEAGSCSDGFPRLTDHLRPLARTTRVGSSPWTAFPAHEALATASATMAADQTITHCANTDCERCRDSIAGGPLGSLPLG